MGPTCAVLWCGSGCGGCGENARWNSDICKWFVDGDVDVDKVSGGLRGELRSYPAKDALSIRCVLEVGASVICTPGLEDSITPPSTGPSGLGGCHTEASLASRALDWGCVATIRRRPEHPRGPSFTPASKRELTNSKHHMAPSPRPSGGDMGIESISIFEWTESQSINARRLQFSSGHGPPRSRERWPGARRLRKMGLAACLSPCEAVQQGLIGPALVSPRSRLPSAACIVSCKELSGQSLGTPAAQPRNTQQTPLFQGLAIRRPPNPPRIGEPGPALPDNNRHDGSVGIYPRPSASLYLAIYRPFISIFLSF